MDLKFNVTSKMIEAGARVLAEDGLVSEFCAEGIVVEVFLAMWGVRSEHEVAEDQSGNN